MSEEIPDAVIVHDPNEAVKIVGTEKTVVSFYADGAPMNFTPLLDDCFSFPVTAFSVDNVLTAEECEEWIRLSEAKGYEQALINVGNGEQELDFHTRNCMRAMVDDQVLAAKLFARLESVLNIDGRNAVRLNERLRFLRYDQGDYFRAHIDGTHYGKDETISLLTIQLYLNDGFKGGETLFLSDGAAIPWKLAYVPKRGSALIFDQELLHEGLCVLEGRKYTVRTDVLFEPTEEERAAIAED